MKISAVIPTFNEVDSLRQLHAELGATADEHGYDLEMIFVDDGSTDGSWNVIRVLSDADPRVRGIRFRRNFGKAAAVLGAGFDAARGQFVLTLDADLQDDPREIPRFLEAMHERQLDVVSGWKKIRHDPWHKVFPSRVFNALVSWLTGVKLHDHNCGLKCYRRQVIKEVQIYGELHRFIPVLAAAKGFRVGEVVVQHRPRKFGQSKYGVRRFFKGFLDVLTVTFLTGFSHRPQHLLGTVGMISFLVGAVELAFLAGDWVVKEIQGIDPKLHERPAMFYALGAVLLGGQLLSIGFLAELMTSYYGRGLDTYSIAELTDDDHRQEADALNVGRDDERRGTEILPAADERAGLRRAVYAILIVLGAAGVIGRILAVDAVDSRRLEGYLYSKGRPDWQRRLPFLSANDRSRWCTIRSLVERGTYVIDDIVAEPNWDTIDAVKHDEHGNAAPGPNEGHIYSSKPPLLATLLAGEYWLIYRFTPFSLGTHPYGVARFILITFNVPLLVVMWRLIARHVERYGRTDWGRMFVVAAAVFGTLLTTFAVSLTNHLVAATAAMLAFDGAVRIVAERDLRLRRFAQVGFFAAFAAANELPALSLFALAGAGLLWKFPRPTLLAFVPAALVVAVAALGTNYLAHGTLVPPYGQREEGNNWYVYQYVRNGRVRNSYWTPGTERGPIDNGEPNAATYAVHALVGHHGIFSLTPIWLLTVCGLAKTLRTRGDALRPIAAAVATISLVCIAFYLTRPQLDRNYGGHSSGFRWVFWFAPLWLTTMLPAVDAKAYCRWCRGFYLVLLALSVVSAAYPTWNPWTLPWLTDWMLHMNWIRLGG